MESNRLTSPAVAISNPLADIKRCWFTTVGSEVIELRIRTSHPCVLFDGQYRRLHHHGSIEQPRLLAANQQAVMAGQQSTML